MQFKTFLAIFSSVAITQFSAPVATAAEVDVPLKFTSLYPDVVSQGDKIGQGYIDLVNNGSSIEDINGFTISFYKRTDHGSFEMFDTSPVTDNPSPTTIAPGETYRVVPNCNDSTVTNPPNPRFVCPTKYGLAGRDYVQRTGGAVALLNPQNEVIDYCEWDSAVAGQVKECKPRSGGVYGNLEISNLKKEGQEGSFSAQVTYKCPSYKECDVTPNTYWIDRRKSGESTWLWDNSVPVEVNPELGQTVNLHEPNTATPYDFIVTLFTDEGVKVVSNIIHAPAWN